MEENAKTATEERIKLSNAVKNYINTLNNGNFKARNFKTDTIVTKVISGGISNFNKAKFEIDKIIDKKKSDFEKNKKKTSNVEELRRKYGNNINAKPVINKFEKGGIFGPKTKENVNTQIIKLRQRAAVLRKKSEESDKKARENFNAINTLNKLRVNNNISQKQNNVIKANREAIEAIKLANEQKIRAEKSAEESRKATEALKKIDEEITVKKEANRKAKEEANRKAKEEANRKVKDEMIAKQKADALAKKKEEEKQKKIEEEAAKKKAAQNQQLRASLTKKVKDTQMNQKTKDKLLNQLKNYSVQIKNIAPSIEQTIASEKLNGNFDEAANKKKRQEVKKELAIYISKMYPQMTKEDRKKYIDRANLTQWRKGILTGTQGMGANRAFERIKGNINGNMKPPPPPPSKVGNTNIKAQINRNLRGRASKNGSRFKKMINNGVSKNTVLKELKKKVNQLDKNPKYK